MRDIRQLLILMRRNINLLTTGMCRLHSDMYTLGVISYDEHILLKRFIFDSRPLRCNINDLWFEVGEVNQRLIWLDSKMNYTSAKD